MIQLCFLDLGCIYEDFFYLFLACDNSCLGMVEDVLFHPLFREREFGRSQLFEQLYRTSSSIGPREYLGIEEILKGDLVHF